MLVLVALGFGACNDDLSQPPVTIPEGGIGTGEWDSPAGVFQVLNGYNNQDLSMLGCWVHGYIVGTVNTSEQTGYILKDETADFTVPTSVNSNLMLAATPDEKDWHNCMTVQISGTVRDALNLASNPDNLGKEVCILGSLDEKYFGAYALKNSTDFNWGDKGIEPDPLMIPPYGSQKIWYKELKTATDAFSFDQGNPSTAGFETWKYSDKYGIVATGGKSGGAVTADAMAISQEISLEGLKEPRLLIHSAANYFGNAESFGNMCQTLVRVVGTETWDQVALPAPPAGNSWDFSNSGFANLDAYAGKKIQIGFRYTSTSSLSGTWEIDIVTVTGVPAN